MTPDELKEARRKLGLSCQKLADHLGMGAHGGRTIRRWERGDWPVPRPVELAVKYLLEKSV